MKVKYSQLSVGGLTLRAPFTDVQSVNIGVILDYLHDYGDQGGASIYNDLTFIGDWNSVEDAQAVFKGLLETRLMRRSHVFSYYDGYDLFTTMAIVKENENNETINKQYIEEDSPIDANINSITTPKNKYKYGDTHYSNNKDTVNDPSVAINIMKFIEKYPSFYNMIEKIYLSLSEEYTSAY